MMRAAGQQNRRIPGEWTRDMISRYLYDMQGPSIIELDNVLIIASFVTVVPNSRYLGHASMRVEDTTWEVGCIDRV